MSKFKDLVENVTKTYGFIEFFFHWRLYFTQTHTQTNTGGLTLGDEISPYQLLFNVPPPEKNPY